MLLELPDLPMTAEEFEKLPNVEGVRFELVEGKLVIMNAFYADDGHEYRLYRQATVKELESEGLRSA